MYRISFALIGLILSLSPLIAQQFTIDDILKQIGENNKMIDAFEASIQNENLAYKTINNLPDPQLSAYYMPFGEHNTNDYTEFELSQRVEFPTVYSARKEWINKQGERLAISLQNLKQDIFLEAKQLALELIHLHKRKKVLEERLEQANEVYNQEQSLFDKGESGILNLNKAKIVWINQQFVLKELENERAAVLNKLETLNGGKEISFDISEYPDTLELIEVNRLWENKMQKDAKILLAIKEEEVARQAVSLEKQKLWPDLTAGYNYQGVAGNNYSGFYGGISIPIWSGRHKVKQAESNVNYQEIQRDALLHNMKNKYISSYQRYELLWNKFKEYKVAMKELQSEELLRRSYELGEISYMDYYYEIEFYRKTENRMLDMEKELQQLKAALLKHQL